MVDYQRWHAEDAPAMSFLLILEHSFTYGLAAHCVFPRSDIQSASSSIFSQHPQGGDVFSVEKQCFLEKVEHLPVTIGSFLPLCNLAAPQSWR